MMRKKKSSFLPESISAMLRNLFVRSGGVLLCFIALTLIIVLMTMNPFLDGVNVESSFGKQHLIGDIVASVKYLIGFIPSLFVFLCLGRFGLSLFVGWDEERAPEYNFLRGFVTLCVGTAALGMISENGVYGGLAGAIVVADIKPILGIATIPMGFILLALFFVMSGILLHIKWYHVDMAVKTTYRMVRSVLEAFRLITPIESDEEEEEESEEVEEEEEEEVIEKPKRSRKKSCKVEEYDDEEYVEHEYELPPPELLEKSVFDKTGITPELKQTAIAIQDNFEEYGIYGKVVGIKPGPIVTQYEFFPEPGTRVDKIISNARDMARALAKDKVRIAPISGTQYMGIETENRSRKLIRYQTLMADPLFTESKFDIPLALGVNTGGDPMYYDLAKMPHMLVAGRTGSGKSVFVQSIITSIVYHFTPDKCKLIIVDPKGVDFTHWEKLPHLITPILTDPIESVNALKWTVRNMDDRYKQLKKLAVRNIDEYNEKVAMLRDKGEVLTEQVVVGRDEETGEYEYETKAIDLSDMPFLVVIIDEVADLMTLARKDVELCVQRLAQKARAAGIHLVMATQRPSADVITGVIKSNFPTRISFQARSNIDSMTTLGEKGAEQLLAKGDMLFSEAGRAPVRIHGALIDDNEVERIANFWGEQGEPEFAEGITSDEESDGAVSVGGGGAMTSKSAKSNDLYDQAVEIVLRDKKTSISYLQRRLAIGYNKAASLIERMEQEGVLSAPDGTGKRHIL